MIRGMTDVASRSFWLGRASYEATPPLREPVRADVVIAGGGFTGLWTAIHLKEADPSVDVVVLEAEECGFGASGRNGGFAMTMLGRNIHHLVKRVGAEGARALHLAMVDSLNAIEETCAKEGIDCDLTHPGLLTVSNGPEQDVRIDQDLRAAERLGLDDFRSLDGAACREILDARGVRRGHHEDHALLVDPAALSRGLRDLAARRGVRVHEGSPVVGLGRAGSGVEARTPGGVVVADRGLIATNAWAQSFRRIRRFVFTVYAYIALTEPLTREQWSRIGWSSGVGIEDKRIMPHFHRPTADGRILWGGRDAPFSPHGPDPRYDRDPRIFARLEETFRTTFPQLHDVRMEHGWAGPIDGSVNVMPSVRWMNGDRILAAVGYAGHGVGPAHLVGRIASDLLLSRSTSVTSLPLVTRRPVPLPPGPLRAPFLNTAQRALQRADDRGSEGGPLARLALRFLQ